MKQVRGFTLLEIMLVLVLVGMISIGVVMTLPSSVGLDKNSQWHAQRFRSLLQLAQDHALISNNELGIEFGEQEYRFALYDLKSKKWQPLSNTRVNDYIKIPVSISSEYSLVGSIWDEIEQEDDDPFSEKEYLVEIEGQKTEIDINPQVFIMSSGEVTPFSYRFYHVDDQKDGVTVTVSMTGQIEVIKE